MKSVMCKKYESGHFFTNEKSSLHVFLKNAGKNDFRYLTTLFQYYIICDCKCNFDRKIEIVCQNV